MLLILILLLMLLLKLLILLLVMSTIRSTIFVAANNAIVAGVVGVGLAPVDGKTNDAVAAYALTGVIHSCW